jgi:hypothetical protein
MASEHSLRHTGRTASFSSITDAFPLLRTGGSEAAPDAEKLWSLMSAYLGSGTCLLARLRVW